MRSRLPALLMFVGISGLADARSASACGSWGLVDLDTKAELRFAAHTVTLYEARRARKVGWLERKGERWFARAPYEDLAWSSRPGDAPVLMTCTSTSLNLPGEVVARVDATSLTVHDRRFETETSPLGRDRISVNVREGDRVRCSGEARTFTGTSAVLGTLAAE